MSFVILDTRPDGNVSRTVFTPRVRLCTVVRRLSDGQVIESQQPAELWHFLAALGLQFTTDADLDKIEIVAGQSDAEFHAQEIARLPAEVQASAVVVDAATLPPQRWRKAWRLNGNAVVINLVEARKLRKAELLAKRDTVLDRIRKRVQEAQEGGSAAGVITTLRNKAKDLRALENTIDEQLAAVSDLTVLDAFAPTEFSGT